MNSKYTRTLTGIGVIAALAFPAASVAKGPHGHGSHDATQHAGEHGGGKSAGNKQQGRHTRSVIVKGVVSAVGTDGTVQVDVNHANHHGSGLVGQTVTFDVSNARIVVRDVNGDGNRDLSDVAVGDSVQLQARVARGAIDPTATITARRMIDKGQRSASDGTTDNGGTTDTGGTTDNGGSTDTGGTNDTSGSDSTPPANG